MTPSVVAYQAAFETERCRAYPQVDEFEEIAGYAVDRSRLERAARVLACPVKANPPNWQHGRVLYAAARRYLLGRDPGEGANGRHKAEPLSFLDIGTAKGFSALAMEWALADAGQNGTVTSVDVIDPAARVRRNTIAEVEGFRTLAEILQPWPESRAVRFLQSAGAVWLATAADRVHFAFVDGKHRGDVVRLEAGLLDGRQRSGDVIVFDDVHIPDVVEAVQAALRGRYNVRYVTAIEGAREYAVATKR